MRDQPLAYPSLRRDREENQTQKVSITELLQTQHYRHFLQPHSKQRAFYQPRVHQSASVDHRLGPELLQIRHYLRGDLGEALEEGGTVDVLDGVHAEDRLVHVVRLLLEKLTSVRGRNLEKGVRQTALHRVELQDYEADVLVVRGLFCRLAKVKD